MKFIKYFSIVAVLSALMIYWGKNTSSYQIFSGETMGTTYNIKIRTHKRDNMLHNRIKKELADINMQMSVFEKDSEINQINQLEADEWLEISPEMSNILKKSQEVYENTNGAFDPTIGKLVDLWGFGVNKIESTPSQQEIDEVLSYSGFNRLSFSDDYKKIKKSNANTYINLSAIAKGYGVDRIATLLKNEGYNNFLVEIGGEIYAYGNRTKDEKGWNIGILNPENAKQNIGVVNLEDSAVATSGDYFNYIYKDNAIYSHTISMEDGRPVRSNLTAVTVFDENCGSADAYATAFMVMGENKALAFANRKNIRAIFFVRNKDGEIDIMLSKAAKKMLDSVYGKN